jgi:hypothetical protein
MKEEQFFLYSVVKGCEFMANVWAVVQPKVFGLRKNIKCFVSFKLTIPWFMNYFNVDNSF